MNIRRMRTLCVEIYKTLNDLNPSFMNNIFKLKLVSAVFYQIFIFSSNDSPSKTLKNVFYFI